jgi:HPt (histidine-containing phosphotransfer) domain-containing protein
MVTNLDYLKELSDGNEEFIKDIVATFVDETPENIKKLQAAISAKDYLTIKTVAHKIKPSMTFFGISELEGEVLALELNAHKLQNLEHIPTQIEKIAGVLNLAIVELKQVI